MICKKILLISFAAIFITELSLAQTSKPPASQPKSNKPAYLLLPEGLTIVDRRAKLIRHPTDNRWFLAFENLSFTQPQSPNNAKQKNPKLTTARPETQAPILPKTGDGQFEQLMEVLPGKWLIAMTRIVDNQDNSPIVFRIWGQVTVYRQRNYILPNMVATESLFGNDKNPNLELAQSNPQESTIPTQDSATDNQVKETPTNQEAPGDNSFVTQELRNKLLAIPRTHVLTNAQAGGAEKDKNPEKLSPAEDNSQTSGEEKTPWKEGQQIIDRVGRLVFDAQTQKFMFAFEADGASLDEPPLIIHPSQLLEVMEREVNKATGPIKFRISGKITKYKGKDYLLLLKVVKVYDWGNLGK